MTSDEPGSSEARLALRAEADVWREYLRAAPASLIADFGFASVDVADGFAIRCRQIRAPLLNRVFGAGVDAPLAPADVDAALAFLEEGRSGVVAVQVGPATRPAAVVDVLRARGFHAHERRVQMVRDVTAPPPAGTTLRAAEVGVEDAEVFGRTCMAGFGMPDGAWPGVAALVGRPGWRCFATWEGASLVGTGALHVQGEVGWLGFAATLPQARGRGGQSRLMELRLEAARAAGCRLVVTETHDDTPEHPNPSLRNMRRAGFRDALWETTWVRGP